MSAIGYVVLMLFLGFVFYPRCIGKCLAKACKGFNDEMEKWK